MRNGRLKSQSHYSQPSKATETDSTGSTFPPSFPFTPVRDIWHHHRNEYCSRPMPANPERDGGCLRWQKTTTRKSPFKVVLCLGDDEHSVKPGIHLYASIILVRRHHRSSASSVTHDKSDKSALGLYSGFRPNKKRDPEPFSNARKFLQASGPHFLRNVRDSEKRPRVICFARRFQILLITFCRSLILD